MEKNNIFEYINNLFLGKTTTSEKKEPIVSDPWELILKMNLHILIITKNMKTLN